MDIEKLIEEAKAYREKSASDQGVVVLFNGDVAGWMNELRNPELWAPGAIAIDAESRVFIAEGGNNYDGSYRWIEQSTN